MSEPNYTITINEDGTGVLDLQQFDYVSRRAQEALGGPIALNGPLRPGFYTLDENAERFFVRRGDDGDALDYE